MTSLIIGFIGIGSALLNSQANIELFKKSKEYVTKLIGKNKLICNEEVLLDDDNGKQKLINLLDSWGKIKFDLVIIQSVSFGFGQVPVSLAKSQNCTVVLWALPEPELAEGIGLQRNSWCGVNMHASHLNKLGIPYDYVYGLPGDEKLNIDLGDLIKIFEIKKKLNRIKIGAIGSRVPGYYDSNFDELSLRASFGIEVEFFDIAEVLHYINKIPEKEISNAAKDIYPIKNSEINPFIENSTKLYLGLRDMATRFNLTALSIKCWPDWWYSLNIVPCSVVSALGDHGIYCGCEGDMLGTVSMLIMGLLNNGVSSLMDIADFNFNKNSFLIFHCGACPTKMCRDGYTREYCKQSISASHEGIAIEFPLKTGKCSIMRLREDNKNRNQYKMFYAEGKGIDKPNIIRGNTLEIEIGRDIQETIDLILINGFEHHYAFSYFSNKNLLSKLCRWLKIEQVFI
ncbi:MAG: hypothetical protein M1365_10120 [Actinobacteria bacterium]|nr:hypothetical protein [Actinomycetota bacterium]